MAISKMRFNEFLIERTVNGKKPKKTSVETYDELKKILDTHCKEGLSFLKNNTGLFRGMNAGYDSFLITDYSQGERKSENTRNLYTVLIDNSPHFKNFPKRSKSMICSNSIFYAKQYGNYQPMAIIPFDGVKIAVCPQQDIWNTVLGKIKSITHKLKGNVELIDYTDLLTKSGNIFSKTNSLEEIKQKITKYLKTQNDKSAFTFKNTYVDKIVNDIFDDLDPKKLGFKLMTIPEFSKIFKNSVKIFEHDEIGSNECWVSGPCVAIDLITYFKLLDGYKNGNF